MASFVEGFAWECDVSAPLTIEGVAVKGFRRVGKKVSGRVPSCGVETAASVKEFVKRYVRRTGALEARRTAKATCLKELLKSAEEWNQWRRRNPDVQPMLACVKAATDFKGRVDFNNYDLSYANLCQAKLQGVQLEGANLHQAILAGADLSNANLEGANFCRADLYKTVLKDASLIGANLQGVQMAMTDLRGAVLTGCTVYGMSAWDLKLTDATEDDLIVKYRPLQGNEDEVRVASLDLAAFMYMTLSNKNLARVMNAANDKWVLILGRFTKGKRVMSRFATDSSVKDSSPSSSTSSVLDSET